MKLAAIRKLATMKAYVLHNINSDPNQTLADINDDEEMKACPVQRVNQWVDRTVCCSILSNCDDDLTASMRRGDRSSIALSASAEDGDVRSLGSHSNSIKLLNFQRSSFRSMHPTFDTRILVILDEVEHDEDASGGGGGGGGGDPLTASSTTDRKFLESVATEVSVEAPDTPKSSIRTPGTPSTRSLNPSVSPGGWNVLSPATPGLNPNDWRVNEETGSVGSPASPIFERQEFPDDILKPPLSASVLKMWEKGVPTAIEKQWKFHGVDLVEGLKKESERKKKIGEVSDEYTPEDVLAVTAALRAGRNPPPIPQTSRYMEVLASTFLRRIGDQQQPIPKKVELVTMAQNLWDSGEREYAASISGGNASGANGSISAGPTPEPPEQHIPLEDA